MGLPGVEEIRSTTVNEIDPSSHHCHSRRIRAGAKPSPADSAPATGVVVYPVDPSLPVTSVKTTGTRQGVMEIKVEAWARSSTTGNQGEYSLWAVTHEYLSRIRLWRRGARPPSRHSVSMSFVFPRAALCCASASCRAALCGLFVQPLDFGALALASRYDQM